MKRHIFGLTVVVSAVLLTTLPKLSNTVSKIAFRKINRVKYQAVKLENSMDAMLNPEQGGISPMPPPPPWIPPVEEDILNKMPPAKVPAEPGFGNYTPMMRHLPPSAPWTTPSVENEERFKDIPSYQIR